MKDTGPPEWMRDDGLYRAMAIVRPTLPGQRPQPIDGAALQRQLESYTTNLITIANAFGYATAGTFDRLLTMDQLVRERIAADPSLPPARRAELERQLDISWAYGQDIMQTGQQTLVWTAKLLQEREVEREKAARKAASPLADRVLWVEALLLVLGVLAYWFLFR